MWQLLQQLEESQGSPSSPGSPATPSEESGVDLAKHLQEMLEMRGQELDEAKRRLGTFKDKLKESQEQLEGSQAKQEQIAQELEAAKEQAANAAMELEQAQANASEDAKTTEETMKEMQERIDALEAAAAEQSKDKCNGAVDPETEAHITRIEGMLIEAKMAWAQAEEDKAMAELKARQLRDQLAKGRDLNLQFAKRMTKLEVKLSKAKEAKK